MQEEKFASKKTLQITIRVNTLKYCPKSPRCGILMICMSSTLPTFVMNLMMVLNEI
jgi:hypothetical protein